ncbi:MAG TPA: hypothetical protein VJ943_06310 [Desulfotignum sp.]|nr:hypothetical protein [Desulfotignum sp.]
MKHTHGLRVFRVRTAGCFFLALMLMAGCTGSAEFRIQELAKTDMDVVANIHREQAVSLLKTLTEKLYKMNSKELSKTPGATIDARIEQIFQCPPPSFFPAPAAAGAADTDAAPEVAAEEHTADHQEIDTILTGFDPDYTGDRVYAVVLGLYTMIHKSYAAKCELYILDFLDAQNLYNSARNIEVLVWRLSHRKDRDGQVFLATNQCGGPVQNLSFERLFGKLISLQDTMSRIVASRGGRMVTKTVHQVAGMVFLPINL